MKCKVNRARAINPKRDKGFAFAPSRGIGSAASPLQKDIDKRFDEVAMQIDGLYKRDEKREQEYLSIREQIRG